MVSEKNNFWAMRRLVSELKAYKGRIAFVLGLGLIISAVQPACLKLTQRIIDRLQEPGVDDFFRWVPAALVGLFLISGLAKYFYNSYRRYVSERIIIKLRNDIFAKYLNAPLYRMDQKKAGEMSSSIQNDLVQINTGLDTLCNIFKEPFIFFGLLGMALYYDWRLTLCALVGTPIVILLFSKPGAAVKKYSHRNLHQFSELLSVSQEALTGLRVMKVFQLENPLINKFKRIHEQYFSNLWKSIRVQELTTPSVEFVGAVLMGAVIVYGRYRIVNGQLTTGELVAFMFALGLIQMPIKQLNNAFLKMKNAEAAAERVYALLDDTTMVEPQVVEARAVRLDAVQDSIRFENVSLLYGGKQALKNVSFEVKRGECIALVGPSGGGKSSLVNLLPRLYDPTEGRVVIDGVDVRDIPLENLRRLTSFVTQDVFLFHDTIYENIRYGKPDATEAEVVHAAEQALCIPIVERAPEGFQAIIGDRGVRLSGGERQRIAIARALLKASPVLVLDEATSNLDTHSEAAVQSALEKLMEGKTTFLIAHRLATAQIADRILVVESGSILEQGSHEELIDKKGLYRSLYFTGYGEAILS